MNFSFFIFHSSLSRVKPSRREGFTLIELLLVMAVMAVLGTLTVGTSRMLVQTSRERRAKVTRDALNVALHRYRTEYQRWPVDRDAAGGKKDYREGTSAYNGYYWYEWSDDNDEIFDALRAANTESDKNPDGIHFFDETTVYTKDDAGKKVVPLADASGSKGHPLCYAMKRDNKPAPFLVWICFDTDQCEVGPRDDNFRAGASDDDDAKYGD